MPLETTEISSLLAIIKAEIETNADEVAALDQAIGDGDHVANLQRGINTLIGLQDELETLDWSAALMKIGMTLMSTMGGASGSLYGSMFLAMSKAAKSNDWDQAGFAEIFHQGVESIKQRGKSDIGEKTMLDTLIPASKSLITDAENKVDLITTLNHVKTAAITGMESTKDMLATKGRASFLGERARGHIDAGARTSQLIICAIADFLTKH